MRPRVVVAALVVIAFAAGMVYGVPALRAAIVRHRVRSSYIRELSAAKRANLPVDTAGLCRMPPADQNAAPLYQKLLRVKHDRPLGRDAWQALLSLITGTNGNTGDTAAVERLLATRPDVDALVHAAAARPACCFQRDYWISPSMVAPEPEALRLAAFWLAAEGRLNTLHRRWSDAVANEADVLQVSRHTAAEPGLALGLLPAIYMQTLALNAFTQMMYTNPSDPRMLAAIDRAITERGVASSLSYSLCGELVSDLSSVRAMRTNGFHYMMRLSQEALHQPVDPGPPGRQDGSGVEFGVLADVNGAFILRTMRHLIASVERPYPQARRGVREVLSEVDACRSDRLLEPLIDNPPTYAANLDRYTRAVAKLRVVRCAAAVLAFRARTGSLPARLVDACPDGSTDPFTMQPLGYRHDANAFVIYSAGPHGEYSAVPEPAPASPRRSALHGTAPSKAAAPGNPTIRPGLYDVVFYFPKPAYMQAADNATPPP